MLSRNQHCNGNFVARNERSEVFGLYEALMAWARLVLNLPENLVHSISAVEGVKVRLSAYVLDRDTRNLVIAFVKAPDVWELGGDGTAERK